MISLEAGPTLQRIVMPRTSRQILIDMQVPVGEHIETSALLVADDHRHGILKFLAETNVQHATIQRTAPHADVVPARPRKRSRSRAGQNQIGGSGKHVIPPMALYCRCAFERCLTSRSRDRSPPFTEHWSLAHAVSGSSISDSWRTTITIPESDTWNRRLSASRSYPISVCSGKFTCRSMMARRIFECRPMFTWLYKILSLTSQ